MNKHLKLTRLAAFLIVLAMLVCSFPAVYSEEQEVTEEVPTEVTEVTETEPETAPAPEPRGRRGRRRTRIGSWEFQRRR